MKVYIEIVHVLDWRRSIWDDDVPSREGWFVTCSECGRVTEDDWTYESRRIAQIVATRHGRKPHEGAVVTP